jgi:TrmH family RNA methyltransferase
MPRVKSVTSRDNPQLLRLRKLARDPVAYRKSGAVWIEGEHLCAAYALRGGAVPLAVVTEAGWEAPTLRRLAGTAGEVLLLPPALMKGLSTLDAPAALAFVVPWPGSPALVAQLPTVVLDRVQDAGNVGAVLRSASAFGFRQVVALTGTAALWSPKVLRAAMGAHFSLHLVEGAKPELLDALGVPLLAASSHAKQRLDGAVLPWPCAWVLGHEGQGISPPLLARCTQALRIEQPGGEESLNVAAAAAICFYESARQRHPY